MRISSACAAPILAFITVGCPISPDYEELTAATRTVRLVLDTADVQHLISQQESISSKEREEIERYTQDILRVGKECDSQPTGTACHQLGELLRNDAKFIPERTAFLNAMAREPGVWVPPNSYCRVVKRSPAMCSTHPQHNSTFVRVRISTGPSKGVEGWGCEGENVYSAWPML